MSKNLILILGVSILLSLGCKQSEVHNKQQQNSTKVSDSKQTVAYTIEPFVKDLEVPWSIVFTGESRILVNERPGRLRVVENGVLKKEPLKEFKDISSGSEEGLMGLALDPDYNINKLIYVSYAYEKSDALWVKVVRFKDNGNSLSEETIVFDGIPAEKYHAGCRLRFGPDKKLYITTGDAGERKYAKDLGKLHGKILRINGDGTIPSDNTFTNSPCW